jgi:hypothetical protein
MKESKAQQAFTLEQVAKMAQEQKIAQAKLPGELERQKADLEHVVAQTGEIKQRTDTGVQKLNRQKYQDFLDDLSKMDPNIVGMADRAEFLNDIAKRHQVPQGHPMYTAALRAHQDPATWEKFVARVAVSPETRYKEEQSNARTDRSNDRMEANTRLIQDTNERIRREDREAKLKIAEMRIQEAQKAALQKNYMVAALHFRGAAQAAEAAGEAQRARELYAESFRNEELDRQQKAAGANAPGKQPLDIPGMPPRAAPPAAPGPGPANVNAMPGGPAAGVPASAGAPPVPQRKKYNPATGRLE